MQDIEQTLAIEIKKEIADRYFGFRKMIEEDIKAYNKQLLISFRHLEETIGRDLIRLYILLKDPDLIREFFQLTGFQDNIFFDPYLLDSPTIRKRLFQGYSGRGLTRRQRFTRLFFDIYRELSLSMESYRFTLQKLVDEQETISEEIKLFYKKNDLSAIMGFFRNLEAPSPAESFTSSGAILPQRDRQLADKMRVHPPQTVDAVLPMLPPLQPLEKIKSPLKQLIHRAFDLQGRPDTQRFCTEKQE